MKIGLMTFHDTTNFGSFLQTFALFKAITNLGFECEIIDYQCDEIVKRELPANKPENLSIKKILKFIIFTPIKKRKHHSLKKELYGMAQVSKKYDRHNISSACDDYDVFVAGSDILWDLDITGGDTAYFLDFVPSGKKKIAFSTSIGKAWAEDELEVIGNLIKSFHHIALREKDSIPLVEGIAGKKVDCVCDPTMLIEEEYWEKYAESSKKDQRYKNKNYILLYFITDNMLRIAKEISDKRNLEIWAINYGLPIGGGVKNIHPTEVRDFLSLIKNANIVLTSSYHGALFSVYFGKPFYVFLRGNSHDVRFKSCMEELKLSDHIFTDRFYEDMHLTQESYFALNETHNWRKRSLETLISYLV